MKIPHFKKLIAVFSVSVMAGLVMIGISIASGAVPAVEPPGAGISPTFTGLDVTGSIENPGANPVTVNDSLEIFRSLIVDESVTLKGASLNVKGSLLNEGNIDEDLALLVGDDLEVEGTISAFGGIDNSFENQTLKLVDADGTLVHNTLSVAGVNAGFDTGRFYVKNNIADNPNSGASKVLAITYDAITTNNNPLILQKTKSQPVQIGTPVAPSSLILNGKLTVVDLPGDMPNLDLPFVDIVASQTLATTGQKIISASCPAGTEVVSCGGLTLGPNVASYGAYKGSSTTCLLFYYQTAAVNTYAAVTGQCL